MESLINHLNATRTRERAAITYQNLVGGEKEEIELLLLMMKDFSV
ncbi:MAG: hypothetical protein K0R57_1663 [Paenibacillaceae bacterium]|jgi:hypothetical protein|nr:hypothetical protein [Paenibacillaceae bacterium]